jgi:CRISPR-associated protein Csm5
MKYRVTCLTPTLVGDGQKLAPIDYMVWKDHINVLDQRRIFRLLAKGPRLDGYLAQLKKADKLDFASRGGFAQNFAGRRIPFEHPSAILPGSAHAKFVLPTFATCTGGPYLPGTAIKGRAHRRVFDRWSEATLRRRGALGRRSRAAIPGIKAEDSVLGGSGSNRMKRLAASDSSVVAYSGMKVYLLRVATLVARGADRFELGWKSMRGSVDARRVEESTPTFAEMAAPGTAFEGAWRERSTEDRARLFRASNHYAEGLIGRHRDYAKRTGLTSYTLGALEGVQRDSLAQPPACSRWVGRGIARQVGLLEYRVLPRDSANTALQPGRPTGMPFQKTGA